MDTRTKIAGGAEFRRQVNQWRSEDIEVAIAAGPFDPLLAAHAAVAADARPANGRLAVIITESASSILDARARAELVAGLAAVDLVTVHTDGLPQVNLDWQHSHDEVASGFVAHVLDRMS